MCTFYPRIPPIWPISVLYLGKSNFPSPVSSRQIVKVWSNILIQTFRRGCPPFIVWIFPKLETDAACQVHVWHVSRAYTIISSSSLSEFIVLNFCPSLNIWWKRGIWFKLVNGCHSEGLRGYFPEFVCWLWEQIMRTESERQRQEW